MRVAVILFNLGGPDSPEAVLPFLRNMFADPAILRVPALLRPLLARIIARRRAPEARHIYGRIGGRSPILPETEAQAAALLEALGDLGEVEVAIAMRYWNPTTAAAARSVAAFRPDRVVLLPLYPQFSTATTASSLDAWRKAAHAAGIVAPSRAVCCYPRASGLIEAQAACIGPLLDEAMGHGRPRLLLSAHGLPEKLIADGDPYQWQVEETARAIVGALERPDLDWALCYQSRVGPLAWIGPSTEEEIDRAGREGLPLVVAPIAFVSEHSETLVELDMTCRERAVAAGVPFYGRAPAVGVHPTFIETLATLVRGALADEGTDSAEGGRLCPLVHRRCALAAT